VLQYLREAGYSLLSIGRGLKVTRANRRRRPVTLLYPEQRPSLAPRFRGLPEVDLNICIVCHLCEKACPTQCIHIEDILNAPVKGEAGAAETKPGKKKEAVVFNINAALCMFCGLCEESCPTKPVRSIVLNHGFEVAKYRRDDLVYGIDGLYVNAPANPPVEK
jgi:NADH-quinone oxidoreductase subunit I